MWAKETKGAGNHPILDRAFFSVLLPLSFCNHDCIFILLDTKFSMLRFEVHVG